MRIYVAGKFGEKAAVRKVMKILTDAGHTITHDWTLEEKLPPDVVGRTAMLTQYAVDDTQGVLDADCYVGVFVKDLPYKGSYAELGVAVGAGKPVILIGQYANKCILSHHPLVIARYPSIKEFLKDQKLFRYAGEVRIKEVE